MQERTEGHDREGMCKIWMDTISFGALTEG
jgi:hypothetical protein